LSGKTVFILGAGASCEAKLPTGDKLRSQVVDLLNLRFDFGRQVEGDLSIGDALRVHLHRTSDSSGGGRYVDAAHRIRAGLPYALSIDNYLHQHRGDKEAELCGKLAIVRAILAAESRSVMHVPSHAAPRDFPQSRLEAAWYSSLWQMLTEGCHVNDLKARFEKVAFVIFNYDRCVEHFLFYALRVFYDLSPSNAQSLLRSIEIYHPYGTVGQLPWWGDRLPAIGFGEEPGGERLLDLSKLIKTFTESVDPSHSDIVAIRELVRVASKLIILGFAFYEQNMKLLWPDSVPRDSNSGTCHATAVGISSVDVEGIKGELIDLAGMWASHIYVRNELRCHEIFGEYRRALRIV
jgi:hypothetical protein